jgi:hypothetical protein
VKRQLNVRQAERLVRRLRKQEAHTAGDLAKLADAIISSEVVVPDSTEVLEDDPERNKVRDMISKALPYAQVEFYFHERKPVLKIQFKNLDALDEFLDKLM